MTTDAPTSERTLRITRLDAEGAALLATGTAVVTQQAAIFRIEGAGAVACMQGLCTNDIQKRGSDTICYGALLTPKGMIILDGWFLRDGDAVVVVADASAREAALGIFRRALPPRLARVTDQSETHRWVTLVGETARSTAPAAGWPADAGKLSRHEAALLAHAPVTAPFGACAVVPMDATDHLVARTLAVGAKAGTPAHADAARILAAFPALGAEIDEKTLPQEVRFDEHAGVSYEKGCYTGQETVARLHFRGHPNRELRMIQLAEPATDLSDLAVRFEGKVIGTARSLLSLPTRLVVLALLRREVPVGATVGLFQTVAVVSVPPSLPSSG